MSKNPNFWHLIPLNPRIKIFFQNSDRVTFLNFIDPKLRAKFQKKQMSSLWDILRLTDTRTTDMDYY